MIQSQQELLPPHPLFDPRMPLPLPPQQDNSKRIQIQLFPEQELL